MKGVVELEGSQQEIDEVITFLLSKGFAQAHMYMKKPPYIYAKFIKK